VCVKIQSTRVDKKYRTQTFGDKVKKIFVEPVLFIYFGSWYISIRTSVWRNTASFFGTPLQPCLQIRLVVRGSWWAIACGARRNYVVSLSRTNCFCLALFRWLDVMLKFVVYFQHAFTVNGRSLSANLLLVIDTSKCSVVNKSNVTRNSENSNLHYTIIIFCRNVIAVLPNSDQWFPWYMFAGLH
jgi:hypothetical protein